MSQSNDSGLNLDRLEALARAAGGITREQIISREMLRSELTSASVLELIALARAALANQPAPTVPATKDKLPEGVVYSAEHDNFYKDDAGMGQGFYERWKDRRQEFPADEQGQPVGWLFGNSFYEAGNPRTTYQVRMHGRPLYGTPTAHQPAQDQAEPVKCRGCNGHGMVGNILDTDVCPFCKGSGSDITAQQEPVAAPDRKLDPEAMRAIRRAVQYLEENDCTGPAEDLKALLGPLADAQLDGGQEGSESNG